MKISGSYQHDCAACRSRLSTQNKRLLVSSNAAVSALRRRIEGHHHDGLQGAHTLEFIGGTLASCWEPSGFVVAQFQHQGVDKETLTKASIREGTVVWAGAYRFAFSQLCRSCGDGEGEPAFVFPIRDFNGRLVDLAAWDPKTDRFGTWLGVGWALGQNSVLRPRLSGGLPVHRTPWGWLHAGGKGIVIADTHKARNYLIDAGPLLAEDKKHSRELAAALVQPLPRILVASAATASREG
ncbi:hypothetical protein ACFOYU_19320 [Microvirga sp. GCM10011540]|uniref:hypothetical protein n=1 Tax=Microvirga sp. GCM10011540 TaxID=3317338 RepID=UPI00361C03C4